MPPRAALLAAIATVLAAAPAAAQMQSPQSRAVPPQSQSHPGVRSQGPQTAEPENAGLQAAGRAFAARMRAMAGELQAVTARTDLDVAGKSAAMDAIVARYTPEAEALATRLETHMRTQGPEAAAQAPATGAAIRAVPDRVRNGIVRAAAADHASATGGHRRVTPTAADLNTAPRHAQPRR